MTHEEHKTGNNWKRLKTWHFYKAFGTKSCPNDQKTPWNTSVLPNQHKQADRLPNLATLLLHGLTQGRYGGSLCVLHTHLYSHSSTSQLALITPQWGWWQRQVLIIMMTVVMIMVIRTMTVIIVLIFITIRQGAFVWKDYKDDYDNNDDDYTIIYDSWVFECTLRSQYHKTNTQSCTVTQQGSQHIVHLLRCFSQ